jgi:hypothetical protein
MLPKNRVANKHCCENFSEKIVAKKIAKNWCEKIANIVAKKIGAKKSQTLL